MYVYIYIYYICNYIIITITIITITTITILDVYLCRFDTYDYTYQVCIHGHAFSCITATSMAPQAALGFSGVVSGGDAAASASKDSTLKA